MQRRKLNRLGDSAAFRCHTSVEAATGGEPALVTGRLITPAPMIVIQVQADKRE